LAVTVLRHQSQGLQLHALVAVAAETFMQPGALVAQVVAALGVLRVSQGPQILAAVVVARVMAEIPLARVGLVWSLFPYQQPATAA
jgi:hypothetical protein